MKQKNSESLFLVTNPNSTRARRVEEEVSRPLRENGIVSQKIETPSAYPEDNIDYLADALPDEGRVLIASGDGVAEQVANAVVMSGKQIDIGVLPFGNYNDTASAHMGKAHTVLDFIGDIPTVHRTPLTIEVDREHLTETFSYATIGLTAIIAAGYRDEGSREKLRTASGSKRSLLRYGQAGLDYLKYAGTKLPDFTVDNGLIQHGRTDIAFTNNSKVAGLLRFPDTFYDKDYFGARTDLDMQSLHDLFGFGVPAFFGQAGLERVTSMRITFEQTARALPFQSGGEYQEINAESIFVYKDPAKKVSYLHPIATTSHTA